MQLFSSSAFKSLFSYKVAIHLSGKFCSSCLDLIQINSRFFVLSIPKAFRLNSVLVYAKKERLAHLIIEYISLYKCSLYMVEVWILLAHSVYYWRYEMLERHQMLLRHHYSQFNENMWFCRINAR